MGVVNFPILYKSLVLNGRAEVKKNVGVCGWQELNKRADVFYGI